MVFIRSMPRKNDSRGRGTMQKTSEKIVRYSWTGDDNVLACVLCEMRAVGVNGFCAFKNLALPLALRLQGVNRAGQHIRSVILKRRRFLLN